MRRDADLGRGIPCGGSHAPAAAPSAGPLGADVGALRIIDSLSFVQHRHALVRVVGQSGDPLAQGIGVDRGELGQRAEVAIELQAVATARLVAGGLGGCPWELPRHINVRQPFRRTPGQPCSEGIRTHFIRCGLYSRRSGCWWDATLSFASRVISAPYWYARSGSVCLLRAWSC